ncbi:hypothetical protein NMY22_g9180 [Coprinellus aureogranulatus]|nr:hypothetical protein NMY22_g9180 [Coprinellus aureogranulatus]
MFGVSVAFVLLAQLAQSYALPSAISSVVAVPANYTVEPVTSTVVPITTTVSPITSTYAPTISTTVSPITTTYAPTISTTVSLITTTFAPTISTTVPSGTSPTNVHCYWVPSGSGHQGTVTATPPVSVTATVIPTATTWYGNGTSSVWASTSTVYATSGATTSTVFNTGTVTRFRHHRLLERGRHRLPYPRAHFLTWQW